MRIRLMLPSLVILALAACSGVASAEVKQVVVEVPASESLMQVGVHFADNPFGGISVKRRVGEALILQGTINLTENSGAVSGRVLFDLGTKNRVLRYTGIGAGMGYEPEWNGVEQTQRTLSGFEGFIGIDYQLDWFGRATPFSTSLEVVVQGINRPVNGISQFVPKTGVDVGISYWF